METEKIPKELETAIRTITTSCRGLVEDGACPVDVLTALIHVSNNILQTFPNNAGQRDNVRALFVRGLSSGDC